MPVKMISYRFEPRSRRPHLITTVKSFRNGWPRSSVSGLMLTTEAMIAEKPEKKKAPAMPPGGMGEDMY